jgi:hypothetical protein
MKRAGASRYELRLGSRLAATALEAAAPGGAGGRAAATFMATYIDRHPEYQDLVARATGTAEPTTEGETSDGEDHRQDRLQPVRPAR